VFATSLGFISVAIAFSSQQTIQNFISRLLIYLEDIVKINDWVEINPPSIIGRVENLNLMRVTIRDINGKIHLFRILY
jgi:small-conductance mechanosensitive channel